VLRFTWEQVMFAPHEVVTTVRAALALASGDLGAVRAA